MHPDAQQAQPVQGIRACSFAAGARWMLALLFAAITGFPAHADDHPLARLATGSRQMAAAVDDALGDGPFLWVADACGGALARQHVLSTLGYFSAAFDVPALANRQWMRALEIAQQRRDIPEAIQLTLDVASSALALGDYERSRDFAERLGKLAREHGDVSGEAQAENMIGVVERRQGHLDAAIEHQQRSLALFKADGNMIGAMRTLSDLGTIWRDRGDFAQALGAQLEATAEREKSGDRLANVYRNLALLYREIEDTAASRSYFQRAIDEATRASIPSIYSSVTGSYASLLNDTEEHAAARKAAEEALAIDTALGDRPHQGFEHLELGRALLGEKNSVAAVAELEQALALGRELDQRELVARSLLHLTEASLVRHDHLRARGLIDEAIAGLEAAHLRPQLAQAYSLREQLARSEHDDAEALRYAHKSAAAREELIGIRASRQLSALEAQHARMDAEQRLALLAKDNELQGARLQAQAMQRQFGTVAMAGLALALLALIWRYRVVSRFNQALSLRNEEIERQRAALGDANATLQRQAADLYQAATTDSLTGVSNRRYLLEQLDQRMRECESTHRPLALMLVDFDNFKQINDLRGHLFGDQVLVAGARAMRESLDDEDLLGRFGGEEFIAVIRDKDCADILACAERLREHVASKLAWFAPDLSEIATISIGLTFLADFEAPARSAALLDAADRALYIAKKDGRNRVRRSA